VKVVALYNIKGGVGKTSTAVNLAYLSAVRGKRTMLWDLDAQGSATFILRVRPKVKGGGKALVRGTRPLDGALKATDYEGLDLLPADFTYRHLDLLLDDRKDPTARLRELLATIRDEYDHVYLDCPPSMSLLSENVLHAADTVLVPLIPTTLSLRTMDMLREVVAEQPTRRPALVGFFSMVDARKRLHREVVAELPAQRRDVSSVAIPSLSMIEQMAARRAPVLDFAPRSLAARRYARLWDELWTAPDAAPTSAAHQA
jgi:cellulose biosynthesis protein BcsQ